MLGGQLYVITSLCLPVLSVCLLTGYCKKMRMNNHEIFLIVGLETRNKLNLRLGLIWIWIEDQFFHFQHCMIWHLMTLLKILRKLRMNFYEIYVNGKSQDKKQSTRF